MYLSCARAVCCSPTLWLSPRQRTECTVIRRLQFGLGVNPRFWSCNRRFAPVAACLDNLTRFFPNSTCLFGVTALKKYSCHSGFWAAASTFDFSYWVGRFFVSATFCCRNGCFQPQISAKHARGNTRPTVTIIDDVSPASAEATARQAGRI